MRRGPQAQRQAGEDIATTDDSCKNDISSARSSRWTSFRCTCARFARREPPAGAAAPSGRGPRGWTFRTRPTASPAPSERALSTAPGTDLEPGRSSAPASPSSPADLVGRELIPALRSVRATAGRPPLAAHRLRSPRRSVHGRDGSPGCLLDAGRRPDLGAEAPFQLITSSSTAPLERPLLARAAPLIAAERFVRSAVARGLGPDPRRGYNAHLSHDS